MNSRKNGALRREGKMVRLGLLGAEDAMLAAVRAIARRDHTEAELRRTLSRRFGQEEVDAAITALIRMGWAGDERVAPIIAEREQRQRPASAALVREKLIVRGVAESLAEKAAKEASAGRSDADRMKSLLLQKFAGKKDVASKRRALAMLARRGFEEEDAIAAVERVLGPLDADVDSGMSSNQDNSEPFLPQPISTMTRGAKREKPESSRGTGAAKTRRFRS